MDTPSHPKCFPTTLWTVVRGAAHNDPAHVRSALGRLCDLYWYPLYSFIRRRGYAAHDAQDLTQEFFSRLLETQALGRADPQQGRFRTFLLAALKNFLANDWDRAHARKRGGGQTIVPLEEATAEARYQLEPTHDMTPERHFERQWALTLLNQVLADLRAHYQAEGKGELFDELKSVLAGEPEAHAAMAIRLGSSAGAIKIAVHRLRRRYRELIRARIADTVGENDVDDEIRHLLVVLSDRY